MTSSLDFSPIDIPRVVLDAFYSHHTFISVYAVLIAMVCVGGLIFVVAHVRQPSFDGWVSPSGITAMGLIFILLFGLSAIVLVPHDQWNVPKNTRENFVRDVNLREYDAVRTDLRTVGLSETSAGAYVLAQIGMERKNAVNPFVLRHDMDLALAQPPVGPDFVPNPRVIEAIEKARGR